jgi:hypothetical protein
VKLKHLRMGKRIAITREALITFGEQVSAVHENQAPRPPAARVPRKVNPERRKREVEAARDRVLARCKRGGRAK